MQKDFHALFSLSIFKWFGKLTCACSVLWFHSFHLLLVVSDTIHWLFFCFCLYFITSLSHFVLRIRCPDGSHQLVWDAVSTDALQRVPQSGASAAGVSTGMRNFFLPQGTHSFPFLPIVELPPNSVSDVSWETGRRAHCCLLLGSCLS